MSIHKIVIALFGNARRDNIIFTLNAGEVMTLNFSASGTNTTINKFYNLKKPAKKVAITVNKISTITHINTQELQSPRTLGTAIVNKFSSGIEWSTIKIAADQAATVVEVYAS